MSVLVSMRPMCRRMTDANQTFHRTLGAQTKSIASLWFNDIHSLMDVTHKLHPRQGALRAYAGENCSGGDSGKWRMRTACPGTWRGWTVDWRCSRWATGRARRQGEFGRGDGWSRSRRPKEVVAARKEVVVERGGNGSTDLGGGDGTAQLGVVDRRVLKTEEDGGGGGWERGEMEAQARKCYGATWMNGGRLKD
ncbi:hypothetical protein ACP70R_026778 [Stipagrostis hirtigluma subsp. patula]